MSSGPVGAVVFLFAAIASSAGRAAEDAEALAQGRRLFTQAATPPCGLCHTLKDAGTTGEIGPALDELKPDAGRVLAALQNGIGVMPSFRTSLDDAQMRALARYVSTVSGGAK